MVSKVIFCALFAIALGQQQQQLPTHGVPATDDGDDGSWAEDKYEAPRSNDIGGRQPQYQQQAQPQFRPQPQPQYQAPASQQYQAPAPQPQYRPAPQPQQQYRPAPQPQQQYRPAPQPQQYQAPAQQSYQAPAQQSYQAPAQQSYQAPAQPQYRPQAQKYSQGGDSRNAAILSEARYLQGDGKFGSAYTQEDGVEFKEESDADGTRRGTYSWVDPSGERRTVSYTAGKNGFQASGAHLPVAPAAPAEAAPAPAPQQQYQAQPQSQYRQQDRAPTSNNYYDVNSNY